MKTPEEIKKGLECCTVPLCAECPYDSDPSCVVKNEDALAYIQQLEAELEAVKRERDAAVSDLAHYAMCPACKHFDVRCPMKDDCLYGTKGRFKWRGPCAENGGIEK